MGAIPGPLFAVAPEVERVRKSVDPFVEQLEHVGVAAFGGEIVQSKQTKEEAIQDAGQRICRILLISYVSSLARADTPILDLVLKDLRGCATEIEEMLLTRQPIPS